MASPQNNPAQQPVPNGLASNVTSGPATVSSNTPALRRPGQTSQRRSIALSLSAFQPIPQSNSAIVDRNPAAASPNAASTLLSQPLTTSQGFQPPAKPGGKERSRFSDVGGSSQPVFQWKWELLAAVLSIASLLAMVGLLAAYDGQPLYELHGVTLNAYVSIFSTVGRTTLVYFIEEAIGQWKWLLYATSSRSLLDIERVDAASRGPWGSALLMWFGRKISLLPLGAIAIILSLALDPFAQQLVQTDIQLTQTSRSRPTVARSTRYSRGTDIGPSGSSSPFADADTFMKTAILEGMTRSEADILSRTSYDCATGNCTWTPYESLAVCNECNSLDGRLTRKYNFTRLMTLLDIDKSVGSSVYGYTVTTENGLSMENTNTTTYVPPGREVPKDGIIYMTAYGTGNASTTATFKTNDLLIWSTTILKLRDVQNPGGKWPNIPLEAIECAVYYCINRYDSAVINSVFSENKTTLTDTRRSPDSWQVQNTRYPGGLDPSQFTNRTKELQSLEYSNQTAGLIWTDLTLESDGSKFNVSQQAVHAVSAYFQNTFRQQVDLRSFGSSKLNGWTLYFGSSLQSSPTIIKSLWDSTDIIATFDALAHSMSNAIRAADYNKGDSASSSAVLGNARIPVVFYSISWGWIVLHAALLVAGVLFLAVTIFKTIRWNVPAWKSHSLPPLAFQDQVGALFADTDSVDEMEKRAAMHQVHLVTRAKTSLPTIQGNNMTR